MRKENLAECRCCPRSCGADRTRGALGACHAPDGILLSRASLHQWEEPCLSGTRGAGTVFFAGCPLGCVYCQNAAIAGGVGGISVDGARFVEILLSLEEQGAHNIDLVTPTHYAAHLVSLIPMARAAGLTIPIVYNCGGYESVDMLRRLEGLVDIYLPDFKYADPVLAVRYSHAPDYPEVARAALQEMIRQCPIPTFDEEGIMRRGVIVRHLMLPGAYRNSHDVVKYLASFGDSIYISLMNQYTPMPGIGERYPELAEPIRDKDYRRLVAYASRLGITQAYVQEGGTVGESFIPPFDGTGVG